MAVRPVLESLEERRLMAVDTVQDLPFTLEFDADRGEILDKDGEGTGFTFVAPNKNGNQYQPNLIDLDMLSGHLKITSSGTNGGNWAGDNTLANSLQTQFDATTGSFTITTRLIGPLSGIDKPSEQAGIIFGPDQDNYIKFVAISQPGGQVLQFIDERKSGTSYLNSFPTNQSYTNIGSFAAINELDLRLTGDPVTGTVKAFYRINGGAYVQVPQQITIPSAVRESFFSTTAKSGLMVMHKGSSDGTVTGTFDRFEILAGTPTSMRPTVTATRPGNGATNVFRDAFVAADINIPSAGHGIDSNTLTSTTVKLFETATGTLVQAVLNTSGGGDAIVLQPINLLKPNTQYTFQVTDGLADTNGAAFIPYTITFTTGANTSFSSAPIAFSKHEQIAAQGERFSGVTMGPDGKLYASTLDGKIIRFNVGSDGTLSNKQVITTVQANNDGPRFMTGLRFDPASTANNLILWVSHGQFAFENATDWTGKISRLSGSNLTNYQDYVVGLPRSVRDHLTNQMDFGPDGKLYVVQGSNTAMGAPDNAWGLRPERVLSGALLQIDTAAIAQIIQQTGNALDVKTDEGGTYNPWAANAPVKLYATGIRNAYDLLWHSNGKLYTATNGSASGGAVPGTPASPGDVPRRIDQDINGNPSYLTTVNGKTNTWPVSPIGSVTQTQSDFLFDIVQGGYYGHPNPTRGEYVMNGGNPTSGSDPGQVNQYPVGTQPDRNWRGFAFEFGQNYSPNGMIEFKGNQFGGELNGAMLVVRFSGGDDIIVLKPNATGQITQTLTGLGGMTQFNDPLDLTQYYNASNSNDARNGFIYVAEYGGEKITLLKPGTVGPKAEPNKTKLYFNDQRGDGTASPTQKITIKNTGTTNLLVKNVLDNLTLGSLSGSTFTQGGGDSAMFTIVAKPSLGTTIVPGDSFDITIAFNAPSSATTTVKTAWLRVETDSVSNPVMHIALRGLPTVGTSGSGEPSLHRILELHEIQQIGQPSIVGDANPGNTQLYSNTEQLLGTNQEVNVQQFVKAGSGPVTIETLAVFGVSSNPAVRFGWYEAGTHGSKNQLFVVNNSDRQSVNPTAVGPTSFDPGSVKFGLYTTWPGFTDAGIPRDVFTEDGLNGVESTAANQRKIRFYQMRNPDGSIVPNAYVMAVEEFVNDANGSYDYQDIVAVIRNVQPAGATPELGVENRDGVPLSNNANQPKTPGVPFPNWLSFNRIENVDGTHGNRVHDTVTLRVRNTGKATLNISGLTFSNPNAFQFVGTPPTSIAAGGFADLTIKFTGNATNGGTGNTNTRLFKETLTINSNDSDEGTQVIQLAGLWQKFSESGVEPSMQQFLNVFGIGTTLAFSGQKFSNGGKHEAVGEEILSAYWSKADPNAPVTVRQLAAFHTQGNTETFRWHNKGSTSTSSVFTHAGIDGQSLFPLKNGLTDPAYGQFNPAGVFGVKIAAEWSDSTMNTQDGQTSGYGHHIRFFPVKDVNGVTVPNTYLMLMDYSGINYDYQDNIYLITNIRPELIPSAPHSLASYGTDDGVHLDWGNNPEGNISGYNVYRSTSSNGTYTKLTDTLAGTSDYTDTTAVAGVTYWYKITAVNTSNVESLPTMIEGTRPGVATSPPTAPSGLNATAINAGRIDVTWNDVADETGYRIERSLNGVDWIQVGTTNGGVTSFSDTTVQGNTTYQYRVIATNSGGDSPASNIDSATTPNTAPSAPTGLNAVATGTTSVDLSWNDVANETGYSIQRSLDGLTGWSDIGTTGAGVTTFTNNVNVSPNTTYYYRVIATNGVGSSSPSAVDSVTTPASAPAAPGNVVATAINAGRIDITWNNVAGETGFRIERSLDGVNGWALLGTTNADVLSFADTTATANTTYHYRVFALNGAVSSPASNVAQATTPNVAPSAPTGLAATQGGTNRIDLSWNAVSNITGYRLERSLNGSSGWTTVGNPQSNATTFADNSVSPNTTYFYRLIAINGAGDSPASNVASATTQAPSGAIRIDSAGPAGGFTDSLGRVWSGDQFVTGGTVSTSSHAVANTVDDALYYTRRWGNMNYAIPLSSGSYTLNLHFSDPTMTAANRRVFNVFAEGQQILSSFDIFAEAGARTALVKSFNLNVNDGALNIQFQNILDNALISAIEIIPNATQQAPAAPANLNAEYTSGQVVVSWSDVTGEAGYRIERSATGTGGWATIESVNADIVTYADTSVTAGNTYYYRVVAFNGAGDSQPSNVDSASIPAVPPAKPTGLVATPISSTRIDLSWDDVAGETFYAIERSLTGTGGWSNIGGVPGDTTTFTDDNVSASTTYYYRVIAGNPAVGSSPASDPANATTPPNGASGPSTPTLNTPTAGAHNQVSLSWSNVANETGYRIERSLNGTSGWSEVGSVGADVLSFNDNSVSGSTTYHYRVVAFNAVGDSPASNVGSVTTPAAPTTPTFTGTNVNNPTNGGSTTTVQEGSAYTITAGGSDIWSTADRFHFANTQLTGDFDISVRMDSFTAGSSWAKAGLMVRESLAGNSRNIFAGARPQGNYRFTRRETTGGSTFVNAEPSGAAYPNAWVRIKREGDVFTMYRSSNGTTWTQTATVTMSLPQTVYVGMAVTANSSTTTATVEFTNLNVTQ